MGPGGVEPPTSRLSANLTEVRIHGKKTRKSNRDCTICRSCRETLSGTVVLE